MWGNAVSPFSSLLSLQRFWVGWDTSPCLNSTTVLLSNVNGDWEHNYLICPFNPLNILNMPEFGHNEESFSLVAQYYLYLLHFNIYFPYSFTLIRALLSKKVTITGLSSQYKIASSNQHVAKRQKNQTKTSTKKAPET